MPLDSRSGTSLLKRLLDQHPHMSGLHGTRQVEDEGWVRCAKRHNSINVFAGQAVTTIYSNAEKLGWHWQYLYQEHSHLTESSPRVGRTTPTPLLTCVS